MFRTRFLLYKIEFNNWGVEIDLPRSNWFPCRKCSSNHLEVLSIWTRKLFSHLCGLFYLLAASVIQRGRSVGLEKITLCAPCNLLITVFRSSSSIGWSMQLNGRDSLCISLYTIFQKISGIFDLNFYSKVSKNRSKWKTPFHMICKEGQLDVVKIRLWMTKLKLLVLIWMLNMWIDWLILTHFFSISLLWIELKCLKVD